MNYETLKVELPHKSYPIYIGTDLLKNNDLINRHLVSKQVLIVSNETVAKLYLERVQGHLQTKECDVILLPDGEEYKNLAHLEKIFEVLLTKKHHRNTTLIALGGGVICDMTGFAAACYQRGVAFIQIPTTLLAQVDASIGGKTAVNHRLGKNMIGAFHQPECVIIDTDVLKTLSEREIISGLAEVIKSACIKDKSFFEWLEKNSANLLQLEAKSVQHAIYQSCHIKADIVGQDEKETSGLRALLNFGHTFGHAIEQVLQYKTWSHGEAVGMGMVMAADLSQRLNLLSEEDFARISKLISMSKLPTRLPSTVQCAKMLAAMAVDKKIANGKLQFVLLEAIGRAKLINQVDLSLVKQVIADYGK